MIRLIIGRVNKQSNTLMNAETSNNRVSKVWKTTSLIFGLGFIFAAGMLLGERIGQPHSAQNTQPALITETPDPKNTDKNADQNPVSNLPNVIADVAAAVAPSVVTIELSPLKSQDKSGSSPLGFMGHTNGPNNSNSSPSNENEGLSAPPRHSLGTGIIMRSDGYILTSAHVIHRGTTIMIGLNDKRKLEAEVVGKDQYSDLAVLKVKETGLPAAKFGSTKNLRAGDWAIAIGSPLGFDHTVTLGIISAVTRSIEDEHFHNREDLIQTDAAINFGNSGGPLLNIKGEVIGINTAIRGDAQNISFAIPVDSAIKVAKELIEHGEIPRPYLGIWMADMNSNLAIQLKLPQNLTGVIVTKVKAGDPGDKAGLGPGDVLQKIDGTPVLLAADVRKISRAKKPGDELEIEYWRKGSTQTRKLTVGKYPSEFINQ
jgi:S1-C subfamily serine protease